MKYGKLAMTLVAGAALALSGCGNSGSEEGKKGNNSNVKEENLLKLAIMSEPPSLNPQKANDTTSGALLNSLFEGLTRVDDDGKVQNAVAEKIDISKDKLTYTFTLKDTKWSNGDTVTANDFKYAWIYGLNPKTASEYATILYPIKGAEAFHTGKGKEEDIAIEAKDDKTLIVTLENPTPYFTELTAFMTYLPVNEKVAKENPKWNAEGGDGYVTNGPFTLSEWKHSDAIKMKKSDSYWDKGNVNLDAVSVKMVESEATANRMFTNGDLDFLGAPFQSVPLDALPGYKKDKSLNVEDYAAIYEYKMNTKGKYTKNENIRKALTLAIDRQGLIDNVVKGEQKPALAMVPSAVKGFENEAYIKDHDVEEAKKALEEGMKELGISKASDIELGISINTSEAHAAIAQYIQAGWEKELGIKVKIDNSEWQVFLDKMTALQFDVGRLGWVADYNDAYTFLERYDAANNGNNDTGWEDPKYTELMKQSVKELDEAKRLQLFKDGQKILMEQYPVAPIYYYTNIWVVKDHVKNMAPNGLGVINLKQVELSK
ncbi:MAG TPA: peptide ABC transporter substrate-binding protein [Kurthia sp.]